MTETGWALGAPEAVQRWSEGLDYEAENASYFNRFEGKGVDALCRVRDELTRGAGEKITYALAMKLRHDGVEGDEIIEGHPTAEEKIDTYTDAIFIDQRRKGVASKGRMSEQRVPFNVRKLALDMQKSFWSEARDQDYFMYLTGERGINPDFIVDTSWSGRANNPLEAPDAEHLVFGGVASSKADMQDSDKMSIMLIERLIAKAATQDPMIQPFMIEGQKKFVLLMHTWQAFDLRTAASENDWIDIQKHAGERGAKNSLYTGCLGEYAGVILHDHRSCVRFNDYGSSGDLDAAAALFLGAQAATCAYGRISGGKTRYTWDEETRDVKNRLAVVSACIYGIKKTRYNGKDFGVINVRTACTNPN